MSISVVDDLLADAASSTSRLTKAQHEILQRVDKLRARLAEGALRVAVLGQFKRGKSTLLNALLGTQLLPTGVTPITSIPTFIKYGERVSATITLKDREQPLVITDPSEIGEGLTRYVSEDKNPENRLAVGGVELALPSTFLACGVILIDTPGIGSTLQHNTAAAEAVLPECDAAVFVLSADPPITDMEVAYLRKIRELIPRIVFVLNKIDLLTGDDRTSAERFLFNELKQRIPLPEPGAIFGVSARDASNANARHDKVALESSGVPSLQTYLGDELARGKNAIVYATGVKRSIALVGELLFQNEFEQKALMLPQTVLEQKREAFELAALEFETERKTLSDVLSLSRKQLLRELEAETDRLWKAALQDMRTLIQAASGRPLAIVKGHISAHLSDCFDDSFRRAVSNFQQQTTKSLSVHRDRAARLAGSVRKVAADIMEIPVVDVHPEEFMDIKHEPYWVTVETPPSITNISTNALANLLPAAMRARRERKQFIKDAEAAVLRNVANLDWAIRQNIDDAFRRFELSLDEQLATSLGATREALSMAVQRHRDRTQESRADVEEGTRAIGRLSKALKALQSLEVDDAYSELGLSGYGPMASTNSSTALR